MSRICVTFLHNRLCHNSMFTITPLHENNCYPLKMTSNHGNYKQKRVEFNLREEKTFLINKFKNFVSLTCCLILSRWEFFFKITSCRTSKWWTKKNRQNKQINKQVYRHKKTRVPLEHFFFVVIYTIKSPCVNYNIRQKSTNKKPYLFNKIHVFINFTPISIDPIVKKNVWMRVVAFFSSPKWCNDLIHKLFFSLHNIWLHRRANVFTANQYRETEGRKRNYIIMRPSWFHPFFSALFSYAFHQYREKSSEKKSVDIFFRLKFHFPGKW